MELAGYYHHFIEGFSQTSYDITSLQKKGRIFQWTEDCQRSFEQLNQLFTTAPVLKIDDPDK